MAHMQLGPEFQDQPRNEYWVNLKYNNNTFWILRQKSDPPIHKVNLRLLLKQKTNVFWQSQTTRETIESGMPARQPPPPKTISHKRQSNTGQIPQTPAKPRDDLEQLLQDMKT